MDNEITVGPDGKLILTDEQRAVFRAAGSAIGKKQSAALGREHYVEMGRKGGKAQAANAKADPEEYRRRGLKGFIAQRRKHGFRTQSKGGKIGGPSTFAKYGRDHYVAMSAKSAAARQERSGMTKEEQRQQKIEASIARATERFERKEAERKAALDQSGQA